MGTLDRYIYRQLLVPVLGAVAALTAITLLSQSLAQFDLIIERGQSAWTFVRVTLYSLPALAGLIFPIALFVGLLIALNRLQGEQEFTAVHAAGVPVMKAAFPAIRIGVYFTLISLASNLFLQPIANRMFREELFRIKTDLVSALIKEGDFATSDTGLTVYVQHIDQNGLLRGIFIRTPQTGGHDTTYVAKEGRIARVKGESMLIMRHGSNQNVNDQGQLVHNTWDEWQVDITPYFVNDDYLDFREGDRYMHELFFPIKYQWERLTSRKLQAEAHARLAGPLYCLSFALLAVVAVLGGRFSRNGYAGRIAIVCAVAAVVRILGVVATTAAVHSEAMNILQYLVPLIPIWYCLRALRRIDGKTKTGQSMSPAFGGRSPQTELRPL